MLKGNSRGIVGENIRSLKKTGLSERAAVLTSMKRASSKPSKTLTSPSSGEDYPYGLRLDLDHETLTKLGIKKLPKAGDQLHLHAVGTAERVSEDSSTSDKNGAPRRSVSLQIKKMHLKA